MAGSRLEKIGTVFTRVTALLRSGAMKREDKPIWYDVYHIFPPKTEPSYGVCRPTPEIQEIFYPEDTIRAKFHQKLAQKLPAENLLEDTTTDITRRAIELTHNMMQKNESLSEDQAIDQVIEVFKNEGLISSNRQGRRSLNKNVKFQDKDIHMKSEGTKTRSFVEDYLDTVKNISDKNVDVHKFFKNEDNDK